MLKSLIAENSSDQKFDFINNKSFETSNLVTVKENNAVEDVDQEHLERILKETDN